MGSEVVVSAGAPLGRRLRGRVARMCADVAFETFEVGHPR